METCIESESGMTDGGGVAIVIRQLGEVFFDWSCDAVLTPYMIK